MSKVKALKSKKLQLLLSHTKTPCSISLVHFIQGPGFTLQFDPCVHTIVWKFPRWKVWLAIQIVSNYLHMHEENGCLYGNSIHCVCNNGRLFPTNT